MCLTPHQITHAGGIVADDWVSIHWQKIDSLISCGLRPWFLDHTEPDSALSQTSQAPSTWSTNLSSPQQPTPTPSTLSTTPGAPYVLPQQQQQQQAVQSQPPAGQQQAWDYPKPNAGAGNAQQWQSPASGGSTGSGGVQAVVQAGQPWEAAPGRWQCDVNITLMNRGRKVFWRLLSFFRHESICKISRT